MLDSHVLHVLLLLLLLLAGVEVMLLLLLLDRAQSRDDVQFLLVQHLFALLHLFAFLGSSVLEPDFDLLIDESIVLIIIEWQRQN